MDYFNFQSPFDLDAVAFHELEDSVTDLFVHDPLQAQVSTPASNPESSPCCIAPHPEQFFQIGTPAEDPRTRAETEPELTVSISTTFHPGAQTDAGPPDLILVSCDDVFFHVHAHRILSASDNGFHALLPCKPAQTTDGPVSLLALPDPAPVLNVVLHTIYHLSCTQFAPLLETLAAALAALERYGVRLQQHAAPHTPLFAALAAHAPTRPIETYALAAAHDLGALAAAVSAHLLAYPLHALSDELALRMGPRYLRRLFALHAARAAALRRLLLQPPRPHPPAPAQQARLTRAWALASAHLVWDARPNLSTGLLQAALSPVEKEVSCALCKTVLSERIQELITEWSLIKRTV